MTNCKPGDLAVVVKSGGWGMAGEISRLLIGRIVRVVRLKKPANSQCFSDLVWEFETPQVLFYEGRRFVADGAADYCLRPIRDPGDDARDETLEWIPSPSQIEALS